MKEQLKHIFDQSACLSKRQLRDYLSGDITHDECHALEHHINTCFFCSEALEGMIENKEDSLSTLDRLNNHFLKERFSISHPNVHLNSIATTASAPTIRRIHKPNPRKFAPKPSAIASAAILAFAVLWYIQNGKDRIHDRETNSPQLAQTVNSVPERQKNSMGLMAMPSSANNQNATNNHEVTDTNSPIPEQQSDIAQIEKASEPALNAEQKTKPIQEKQATAAAMQKVTIEKKTESAAKPLLAQKEKTTVDPIKKQENKSLKVPQNIHEPTDPAIEQLYVATTPKIPEANSNLANPDQDNTGNAKKLFESARYNEALDIYKTQMNALDKQTRVDASLMAARCYIRMGQSTKASVLLESLASNGNSAQKRQAKKLLKGLEKDTEE